MPPLVSIVLPTFNRAPTLGRAIESVLCQTFEDFELIVVDDRSTDETASLMAEYARHDRIRFLTQLRPGCSVARNIGVEESRGRYVAFQDSDDEWLPEKLERAVNALEDSGPELGVHYSDMIRVPRDGSSTYFPAPEVRRGVVVDEDTLDYQVFCIGIQAVVVKRECFSQVGLFDESLSRLIDLEQLIRLAWRYEFVHEREALVKYHEVDGISTDHRALVAARQYLLQKYRRHLIQNSQYLGRQYLLTAEALVACGDLRMARAFAVRAFLANPYHPERRREALDFVQHIVHQKQLATS